MKRLTTISILLALVSCGKVQDLADTTKDLVMDGTKTVFKAVDDVNREVGKGLTNVRKEAGKGLTEARQNVGNTLTQVKQDVDNSLTSIREGIAREGHNGIENAGDLIEGVGQIPREVGNHVLGTDSDTKQDLVDENKKTDEEIAQLEFEIEAIKVELAYQFSAITTDIDNLSDRVTDNKDLYDSIHTAHNNLASEFNRAKRAGIRELLRVRRKIQLMQDEIDYLYDLDLACMESFYFFNVATYCNLN